MRAEAKIDDCGEVRLELFSDSKLEADLLGIFERQHHAGGIYVSGGAFDIDSGRRDLQIRPLLGGRVLPVSKTS